MSETVIQDVVVGEPPKDAPSSSSSSSNAPAEGNDSKDSSYSEEGEPLNAEQVANKIVPESSESSNSSDEKSPLVPTEGQPEEAKQDAVDGTGVAEQVPPENPTIGEELPPTQPLEDPVESAVTSEKRPADEQAGQSPKRVKSSGSEEEK